MWLLLCAAAMAADPAVLFLGNSYTFVGNLNVVTADLLRAGQPELSTLGELRLAEAGYRLADHLAMADGSRGDTDWRAALVTGDRAWNWVILQDQSQIPGFPPSNSEFQGSKEAAIALDDLIEAKGAKTVFLLTWGRRNGDDTNPERFPDFATMEGHLEEGYRTFQEATTTTARPVDIAPAGPAFALVYAADEAAGRDPLAAGSVFYGLYVDDGSHPSLTGTWLAAYALYGTLTGDSPVGLPGPGGVDAETVSLLQEVARAAVFDGAWLPSTASAPVEDTSPPLDTNPPADSAAPDSATPDDTVSINPVAKEGGCGCASTSAPSLGLLGALGLLARRRAQSAAKGV